MKPQPNYPFEFIQRDALDVLEDVIGGCWWPFDAIHASPPCQAFTAYRRRGCGVGDGYPNLIGKVREPLKCTRLPYVIENVPGAPLRDPVRSAARRSGSTCAATGCSSRNVPDARPAVRPLVADAAVRAGDQPDEPAPHRRGRRVAHPARGAAAAMGIDWMTLEELSEAVPPAYTEHIGGYLMAAVERKAAA
jgi:DNA (cytosine-5)-methyltransferase 1